MPEDSDARRRTAKSEQPPDPRRLALGNAIKAARAARRCRSQALLAKAADISVRSVGSAETGEYVGAVVLAAIEAVFGWPANKMTDYLEGDDDALQALPARGPLIPQAASKQLADAGLTMDVLPEPGSVAWLRVIRPRLSYELFHQVVDQMTETHSPEDSGNAQPKETS